MNTKIFILTVTLLFLAQVTTVQAGPMTYAACIAVCTATLSPFFVGACVLKCQPLLVISPV